MSVSSQLSQTARVDRLTPISEGSAKKEYAEHIASYRCSVLQPLTDAASGDLSGVFGKDFLAIGEVADIEDGDRLTIGGKTYRVIGIERWVRGSSNDHLGLRVRIFS